MFEIEILTLYHSNIDVTLMVGLVCAFFRRYFARKVFAIRLLCRTFKEKLKTQEHHPFR